MNKISECPAERATYFFGGKWKIRILFILFNQKKVRFGILKKTLSSITQQMLSKQLKELEIDGLVNREVKQVMPPKVEYSISTFGRTLTAIISNIAKWGIENEKHVNQALSKLNKNNYFI